MSNNSRICRTCLNKSEKMLQIFNVLEIDGEILNISDILGTCTGLQIIQAANLPDHICMECVIKLSQAFVFRKQCISADALLKEPTLDIKYVQLDEAAAAAAEQQQNEIIGNHNVEDEMVVSHTSEYLSHYPMEGEDHEMFNPNGTGDIDLNFPVKLEIEIEDDGQEEEIGGGGESIGESSNYKQMHSGGLQLYSCNICGKSFNEKRLLTYHIKSHQVKVPTAEMTEFPCNICGEIFDKKQARKTHMRLHNMKESYKCAECNQLFATEAQVRHHMASHMDNRPFVCTICDLSFKNKNELKRHTRLHLGSSSVSGMNLGMGLSGVGTTNNSPHRKKIQPITETLITCPVCMKSFKDMNLYEKHQRLHNPELPCQYCNKKFAYQRNLDAHEAKYHANERPTECEICGLKFMEKKNLIAHMGTHIKTEKTF